MMATPGKGATKKEKKKPIPVKTSLNNPYTLQWSILDKEKKHFILTTLKDKLTAVSLQKKRPNTFRDWGNRKRKNKNASKSNTETPPKPPEPSWTNAGVRKQLAIGINEVTKGLERNELSLVLVCNSVVPSHMTTHLIPLSKTRSVPACQVPRLSESLSGVLGLKCVLALGIKRDAEEFADVVGSIADVVPPLNVSWVPTRNPDVEMDGQTETVDEQSTDEQTDNAKGQKRKLEEILGETPWASPIFQPLKVKKIVPNPTKMKKPKEKRKKK